MPLTASTETKEPVAASERPRTVVESRCGDVGASRAETWLFVLACFVLALFAQGSRGLWETDEGRYAEAAREMLATGDWMVPRLRGVPHLTKPPVTYWAVAGGMAVLGVNEWGARCVLALAFASTALLVRRVGRALLGDAAGRRAGWMFLTMLYPFVAGNVLTTDTFLSCAVLAAIGCAVVSWRSAHPRLWLAASGAALGAAFLVKGPAALLPFAGFAAGVAWVDRRAERRGSARRSVMSIVGAVLFLAVGSSWFLAQVGTDVSRLDYFVRHEVLDRIFTSQHNRAGPWWIYTPLLVAGSVPWTVPALRGLRDARRDDAARVLLCWIAIPLLVLTLAQSRMSLYVLPLAAPIALLAARGSKRQASVLPARPAALAAWCAFLLAVRVAGAFVSTERDVRAVRDAIHAADPDHRLPVGLVSGRDMWGLDFYLGGRVSRLAAREAVPPFADGGLRAVARRRRAAGEEWLLVAEEGKAEQAVRRIAPDAVVQATPAGWVLYRVGTAPK